VDKQAVGNEKDKKRRTISQKAQDQEAASLSGPHVLLRCIANASAEVIPINLTIAPSTPANPAGREALEAVEVAMVAKAAVVVEAVEAAGGVEVSQAAEIA
jgi:hypothetical protein